jgi:serine/threonine protein kinase
MTVGQFYGLHYLGDTCYLVMEYMAKGSLVDVLRKTKLSDQELMKMYTLFFFFFAFSGFAE